MHTYVRTCVVMHCVHSVITSHSLCPPTPADHLVTIDKDNLQFTIRHCHRNLPVAYDVSGWVRQARDHPSYRVVSQVLNESKR